MRCRNCSSFILRLAIASGTQCGGQGDRLHGRQSIYRKNFCRGACTRSGCQSGRRSHVAWLEVVRHCQRIASAKRWTGWCISRNGVPSKSAENNRRQRKRLEFPGSMWNTAGQSPTASLRRSLKLLIQNDIDSHVESVDIKSCPLCGWYWAWSSSRRDAPVTILKCESSSIIELIWDFLFVQSLSIFVSGAWNSAA